ncbi:S8 family serine peptidase [Planobispora takensis]|uniref:Peptidase S8/S53 domain-containing protein n=1 Tax=Planobispora takensis TaxID=1367882 RepID=A0A8J3WUU1_9ACTN|nr:hypothetical protein Pta02_50940 [Planobispora takensis]
MNVLRRLAPSSVTPFSSGVPSVPEIVVAEMEIERAKMMRQSFPQVRMEADRLLTYTGTVLTPEQPLANGLLQPLGQHLTLSFLVRNPEGQPIPGAMILITGTLGLSQAITGNDGRASVTLVGEVPESIQSVLIDPPANYWNAKVNRPALATGQDNLVTLMPLSETFPDFPQQQIFGWGQRAMSLDRVSPTLRGKGVKIAIIDSGADAKHPILRGRITDGVDFVDDTAQGWAVDVVRHGSHCAGVITGADTGVGIFGFASEAEVHVCKIFPGGYLSDFVDAVNYCTDRQMDVVNLSLGTPAAAGYVADAINAARAAGVACIAAAGNTGGPVNFPGSMPAVLTVAAIGKLDTYPAGSSHGDEALDPVSPEGYFAAKFSCYGPEVDVCAPGVAILSSVPDNGYAVWDGTSMAAPHVTGLAALVLAHREEFSREFAHRDARRVDRLFEILKSSCTPLDLGQPYRTGVGIPDALRALGAVPTATTSQPGDIRQLLEQLLAALGSGGVSPSSTHPAVAPLSTHPTGTTAPAQPTVPLSDAPSAHPSEADIRAELRRLDEEMYAAGLRGYAPDPLL